MAGIVALALVAPALADPLPRIVVPITQHVARDAIFYAIPVLVDGVEVDAYIDTGSMGLQVAASALKTSDVETSGRPASTVFADGVSISGYATWAIVSIGGLSESVPLRVIQKVGCAGEQPKCRARGHSAPSQLWAGLNAIIGLNPVPTDVRIHNVNPLEAIGASWLIILPKPGASQPGQLILNPDADDLAGFTNYPAGIEGAEGSPRDNPLPGCLKDRDNGQSYCRHIVLDSGTSAILVPDPALKSEHFWPLGTHVTLSFDKPGGGTLSHSFVIGPPSLSTRVVLGPFPEMHVYPPQIVAGVEPYLEYEVYYDPEHAIIGLKPRG